jgi:hypothetical protein
MELLLDPDPLLQNGSASNAETTRQASEFCADVAREPHPIFLDNALWWKPATLISKPSDISRSSSLKARSL